MCKKVLIATLAVVVAVGIIGGARLARGGRCVVSHIRGAFDRHVPPPPPGQALSAEIAQLRRGLDRLARDDDKHFEKVARQGVEVEKLEARVAAFKKALAEKEKDIRGMRA